MLLDRLEAGERPAELAALPDIADGHLQCRARRAGDLQRAGRRHGLPERRDTVGRARKRGGGGRAVQQRAAFAFRRGERLARRIDGAGIVRPGDAATRLGQRQRPGRHVRTLQGQQPGQHRGVGGGRGIAQRAQRLDRRSPFSERRPGAALRFGQQEFRQAEGGHRLPMIVGPGERPAGRPVIGVGVRRQRLPDGIGKRRTGGIAVPPAHRSPSPRAMMPRTTSRAPPRKVKDGVCSTS